MSARIDRMELEPTLYTLHTEAAGVLWAWGHGARASMRSIGTVIARLGKSGWPNEVDRSRPYDTRPDVSYSTNTVAVVGLGTVNGTC